MANINILDEQGSTKCLRFSDGTKPVCNVEGQLGHLCQPCSRQDQAARTLFDNGTPQARCELLQREHQNLYKILSDCYYMDEINDLLNAFR